MPADKIQVTIPRAQFEVFMEHFGYYLGIVKGEANALANTAGLDSEHDKELVQLMTFHDSLPSYSEVHEADGGTLAVDVTDDETCLCPYCKIMLQMFRKQITPREAVKLAAQVQ